MWQNIFETVLGKRNSADTLKLTIASVLLKLRKSPASTCKTVHSQDHGHLRNWESLKMARSERS